MNLKVKLISTLVFLVSTLTFGQIGEYDYQCAISGINDQWHQLTLPETIFEKVNPNFSDLRIYGITADKDTLEVPYLLDIGIASTKKQAITFDIINKSLTKDGHYFTFELKNTTAINQIFLDLKEQNFDWKIKLEGSQNQQNWFTIKDNYRIVSINNESADYRFTTLNFPTAKYRYYRLLVKTSHVVTLKKATLDLAEDTPANYQTYPISKQIITQNKKQKNTLIELELANAVPLSYLAIQAASDFDFYRPLTIQYLRDSIQTEKGWRYNYRTIKRGIFSSLQSNEFKFNSTISKKWKVIIYNQDNPPLDIKSINTKGHPHKLIARFDQSGEYFLTYGQKNARLPNYDIGKFKNKIPQDLSSLILKSAQIIPKKDKPVTKPFFENKLWLWGLMVCIILVLGWFTMKMLRESN